LWGDLLEFAFATQGLRKLCLNAQAAERKLGKAVAALLRHRLSDLRAAENVNDVPIGKPVPMQTKGELGVDLGEYSLIFRANHDPVPRSSTKDTDWSRVSRIQFLRIEEKRKNTEDRRG
jgi:proteic killer suppression protein